MRCSVVCAITVFLACGVASAQSVLDLSKDQRRQLAVFGMKAGLGLSVGPSDIKNVPSGTDLETLIATGLNGNGLLCAEITVVRALKMKGKYEVTCIAYRGGSGTKLYVVDALVDRI